MWPFHVEHFSLHKYVFVCLCLYINNTAADILLVIVLRIISERGGGLGETDRLCFERCGQHFEPIKCSTYSITNVNWSEKKVHHKTMCRPTYILKFISNPYRYVWRYTRRGRL